MTAESLDTTRLLLPIYAEDHIQGPECAPYTLIQYGDYKSSACRQLFFLNDVPHHEISGLRRALKRSPNPLAASG
jgi:hypothetical protein